MQAGDSQGGGGGGAISKFFIDLPQIFGLWLLLIMVYFRPNDYRYSALRKT